MWNRKEEFFPKAPFLLKVFSENILFIYFCLVFTTEESLLEEVTEKSALYRSKINMEFINKNEVMAQSLSKEKSGVT